MELGCTGDERREGNLPDYLHLYQQERIIKATVDYIDGTVWGGFSIRIILHLYHKRNKSIAYFEWL